MAPRATTPPRCARTRLATYASPGRRATPAVLNTAWNTLAWTRVTPIRTPTRTRIRTPGTATATAATRKNRLTLERSSHVVGCFNGERPQRIFNSSDEG